MAGRVFWTQERRAALEALLADRSISYAEAARQLSRRWRTPITERAVHHVAQSLALPAATRGRKRSS